MAKRRPFFSIVIPCYNDGRYAPKHYLDRLLNNIVEQGLKKSETEVIVVDDHSPMPYDGTLKRYKDKLNIIYVENNGVSCPGNTRQAGVDVASGKWLCFADHDDEFYPDALKLVKQNIEGAKDPHIIYSAFNKIGEDGEVVEEFRLNNCKTWLHGKFYNVDSFWKPFDLHFVKDLKTHEDVALGGYVEKILTKLSAGIIYLDTPTYKWNWNKDSISHSSYVNKIGDDGNSHSFLETHYDDYLAASIDVLLDCYNREFIDKPAAIHEMINCVISAWLVFHNMHLSDNNPYLSKNMQYYAKRWVNLKEVFKINLPYMKVLLNGNYRAVKNRFDEIANANNYTPFIDWLSDIDKIEVTDVAEPVKLTKRPFFSCVIACYNDGRYKEGVYLDRLLSSLTRQGLDKADLEVVLSDDCSPEPFNHIWEKYTDKLTIKTTKTDYNFAPGNTRAKGVEIATGSWLCFADHDDIFYDNALKKVKNAIIDRGEKHFVLCDFNSVNPEGQVIRKYEQSMNWCHGKFYNRDDFWDKYNIHFIHDLKSHEDIAICTQVSCVLTANIQNYTYVHEPVYAWTDNPQSVSHAKYTVDTESGPREFLEVFFGDYIESTGYIYIDRFKKHLLSMANSVKGSIEIICYCYFYMQGFMFRRPDDYYKENIKLAGDYVTACKKTYNITNDAIYKVVASNKAFMYYQVMELANGASGRYIPTYTFKEWLELVSPF